MAEGHTVEGRQFRTRADYEAALRDKKKIDAIKAKVNLNRPQDVLALYEQMQGGSYRFESVVGNDFDDQIYELVQKYKKEGTGQAGKKAKGKWLVALCSIGAVIGFGYFFIYYYVAERTNASYQELAGLKNSEVLAEPVNKGEEKKVIVVRGVQEEIELPDVLDDYKTLYNKNKRLIGWLKIDDTIIDYPVMQTSNNEYYLDHNFNQEKDNNGSIFMDKDCVAYPRSQNLILYGHHMKSGKMFGDLEKYASESFYEKHSVIQFDTIYEKSTYQVMYVFRTRVLNENEIAFKYYQFIEAKSEEEFNSYMNEMAEMSLYDTGVTAEYGDELLTLSTCDHSQTDGRFAVVAKRIK